MNRRGVSIMMHLVLYIYLLLLLSDKIKKGMKVVLLTEFQRQRLRFSNYMPLYE